MKNLRILKSHPKSVGACVCVFQSDGEQYGLYLYRGTERAKLDQTGLR